MPKKSSTKKNKKENQTQSPSNSRSFTDKMGEGTNQVARQIVKRFGFSHIHKEWGVVVFSFVVGVLVMSILFIAVDILQALDELEMKKQERMLLVEEIGEWEEIVSKYPDYRDGYFKLALLYYQSGKKTKAEENLILVKNVDPHFEEAKVLEEKLKRN